MDSMEKKISDYIDSLNKEKRPKEHGLYSNGKGKEVEGESAEYEKLMDTVRTVRTLKEYEEPRVDLEEQLLENIREYQKSNRNRKRLFYGAMAAVIAITLFVASFMNTKGDIVQAMVASYKDLKAYHGIIEIIYMNEVGEETVQGKREVWADESGRYVVQELEGSFAGEKTVNNGSKKWHVNPKEKIVEVYEAFPDTSRFTFEIGNEIQNIQNALQVKEMGEDRIYDKPAVKIAVTPQGGETYYLWIDKGTSLPIQRETPMQNAVQYRVTYVELESIEFVPEELFTYEVPKGYTEADRSLEQVVASTQEAEERLGFKPVVIEEKSDTLILKNRTVDTVNKIFKIYYKIKGMNQEKDGNFILLQKEFDSTYETTATSILGTVNGNQAEYIPSLKEDGRNLISYATSYGETSEIALIRWQENGYEYGFIGDVDIETLMEIGSELIGREVSFVINDKEYNEFQPEMDVKVDLVAEENTQKSVDSGSSPWKLDPAYVASVEASILVSPDGIVGESPIEYEDIEIIYNDGIKAIAEIKGKDSSVQKIYMEKLIRKDETGIWTVIGYDVVE